MAPHLPAATGNGQEEEGALTHAAVKEGCVAGPASHRTDCDPVPD
jgi:hypothetical protein